MRKDGANGYSSPITATNNGKYNHMYIRQGVHRYG